jgi:hypothetical protein
MLKYFSVLYAGHVLEGEGIGFDGIPANERWYANDRCARSFDIARDLAQHMEESGYDILRLAEHHFQREGYECIPNIQASGRGVDVRDMHDRDGAPLERLYGVVEMRSA